MSEEVGKSRPSRMRNPVVIQTLTFARFRITGITHTNNATNRAMTITTPKKEDEPLNKIIPKTPIKRSEMTTTGRIYIFLFMIHLLRVSRYIRDISL
jgi:hypothetical protein